MNELKNWQKQAGCRPASKNDKDTFSSLFKEDVGINL